MERLIVQNFLTIKHADIELRRFNILIGPQASGKSLIAKLLYFFKQEVGDAFVLIDLKNQGDEELKQALVAKFEEIFPRDYWNHQEFQIYYEHDMFNITIYKNINKDESVALIISYSTFFHELKQYIGTNNTNQLNAEAHKDALRQTCRPYSRYNIFETQIFIPASRSIFANIQNNISLITSNILHIDYFLKKFNKSYEDSKSDKPKDTKAIKLEKKANNILSTIISGNYYHESSHDWIIASRRKVHIFNASSGQQESLPMLLVLSTIPLLHINDNIGFYIEEPEAHLFPSAQKEFMSLLALIYNETSHQFFITTHSPYLLTALNNCILAHETYASASDEDKPKVLEIMPKQQHIAFSDVAAWTITEQGDLESIRDEDLKLIGADIIDEVSNHFQEVTSDLLDIRYKDANA